MRSLLHRNNNGVPEGGKKREGWGGGRKKESSLAKLSKHAAPHSQVATSSTRNRVRARRKFARQDICMLVRAARFK